ncbi:Dynamin-like GTPase that mediates homotypic ER fusion [Serendipita sp. 405]|nr:Dynamin-like GTPase that mediates homotypic ER fusion [Serendipita sp. 405]
MTSYTTSTSPARQSPNPQSSPSNVLLSSSSSSSLLKRENGGINMSQAIAERIQVVDEQKQFNPLVGEQITKWGLQDAGFLYNIVAVFGSQSTGKSTLLNRLFGTTFDVMDETRRQQTTKGIWMCRAQTAPLLVMDVEGTDGRERGEDQDFERKSALFSLASSEVLIMNLWEHQVGLYHGANMALLKTVFEVNLSLFGKRDDLSQRTLLLFVIRDHLGTTPIANLQATLTQDLHRIWDGLAKPQGLASAKLEDYFDLAFEALAHKILTPDKFESGVANLRKKFTGESGTETYFKPVYHKRIPADGVSHYMAGIWEQVQSNKDLDLPTQQELLAQFRCDEIAAVSLSVFNEEVRSVRRPVESGNVIDGLGSMMTSWKENALNSYDHAASRYHAEVYKRKRLDLVTTIHTTLHPLFYSQLKNLSKLSLSRFKAALGDGLKGVAGYDFAEVVDAAKKDGTGSWDKTTLEMLTVVDENGGEWRGGWEEERALLITEMGHVADVFRKDETTKMVNQLERSLRTQLADPVDIALSKPSSDMWNRVLSAFGDLLGKAEKSYFTKATAFNCSEEENEAAMNTLRRRAWTALLNKIREHTADAALLARLRSSFEERFRYDENGVPRVWKPEDDIDGVFKKARDATLDLVPLYARISPLDTGLLPTNIPSDANMPSNTATNSTDELDFEDSLVLLSEPKQLDLTSRFRRDADAYYVEAKRSTVSSVAQIPYWMYGVLVVLGWNEAMLVLFNPLYFAVLLGLLGATWVIVQLNLVGPLYAVARTVTGEVQRQASARLREHFSQPVASIPDKPENDIGEEVEMKKINGR